MDEERRDFLPPEPAGPEPELGASPAPPGPTQPQPQVPPGYAPQAPQMWTVQSAQGLYCFTVRRLFVRSTGPGF